MTTNDNYNEEWLRLKTFNCKDWYEFEEEFRMPVFPFKLAKHGFMFCPGDSPHLQCFFCDTVFHNIFQDINSAHKQSCCMSKSWINDYNIPLERKQIKKGILVPLDQEETKHSIKSIPLSVLGFKSESCLPNMYAVTKATSKETYYSEELRLCTFTSWPSWGIIDPKECAKNGFYFLRVSDRIECAFCHRQLQDWDDGDNVATQHLKYSPNCSFITGKQKNNISRESQVKHRLSTFKNWPHKNPSAVSMANAGFRLLESDKAECVYCKKNFKNWKENDDPWEEHARLHPQCPLVEASMTPAKLHTIRIKFQTDPVRLPNNDSSVRSAYEELRDQGICKICIDHDADVVFLPCGHLLCCNNCSKNLTNCPVCRITIKDTIRTALK